MLRPKMAQHSRKMASAVYQFDNDIGWFDNIWMSKPNGQKWIQIDLGDIRTVKAILIRGGFYQGKECRPGHSSILSEYTVQWCI